MKQDKKTPTVREEWLTLTKEAPIDPDLPICDSHHHLMDLPDLNQWGWQPPADRYLVDELRQDIAGGHNIVRTVFIECSQKYRENGPQEMKPVGETEFIVAQTAGEQCGTTDVAAGIVGFADLTLGAAVAPVLEAHVIAGRKRFRGIRHACSWHASPDIMSFGDNPKLLSDARFREGFKCLAKYGLSFDALVYHTQLLQLADLARAFPDTTIIVNHNGIPLGIGPHAGKREEVFEEWKRGITALATYPNVVIKLGGFGMPMRGFGWHEREIPPNSVELAGAMAPYCLWCIEQFGVDRCMFESNFPVDKVSYSYTVIWNAFKRVVSDFSANDRSALFHDTAVKMYQLTR